jgi:hypothetical protein
MRTVTRVVALPVALALSGCFFVGGTDEGGCDPAPVLAAASDPVVATSCPATVSYEGEVYYVGCARVHESRVGPVIEHGPGETRYQGARRIVGVPVARLFLLIEKGDQCGDGRPHVARGDLATPADYRLARSPLRRAREERD